MLTAAIRRFTPLLALLLCLLSVSAFAMPSGDEHLASRLMGQFQQGQTSKVIVDAATYLFWSLATISLVWTMAIILLRRADFGELFLELVRFIVFTGLFYWLLEKVSGDDGFIYNIFNSFMLMGGASGEHGGVAGSVDGLISIGRNIFYRVIDQAQNTETNDTLILAGMSLIILAALTLVAAQMVLVAIMAWMLAYGGIFLLGFGGARWTSLIAINYYKHAVAVGIALLALLMLMTYGFDFLNGVAAPLVGGSEIGYIELADMFVVALIMAVLGIKLPGLLYTLVTGSPLGLLAGTASMAGTAIMTGGGGAIAAATNAVAQHTSSRRENHYASAVDAFRNVSPDLQRGDTMYQDMNVGAYGLGTANGQPPAKPGGQVFGGTPPVSVWNGGAGGQPAGQPHQVSAQASAQTLQESNAGAGHAPANTESPQAVSQGGAYASAQNPGSAGSIPSAVSGTATDQAGSQPTLDTSSIGQAASLGTSGIEHMSAGGFQPTSLQPSTNSATGNPQQIQQAASTMSSDSAQAPVGGFQPTALSSAITQREGARASTQTGASLPPIPAPLTQDVEETITRRIKQKAVDQRETSIDPGMIGSNHRTNGKPPAADANDEVAAFRDRRSPWGEDDAKGGTT